MSEGIPFRKLIAACLVLFGLIGALAVSIGYFYRGVNNISFVAPAAESSGDEFLTGTVTDSRPTTEDDTGIRLSSPPISNRQKTEAQKASVCADKMRSLGIMAEKCLDIEPLVKALRQGVYIFNKPERAYVGKPFRIVLVLKTDPSQDPGPSFAKTVGPQESVAAAFGQLLDATLRGTDLTVDPSGPQRRAATLLRSTEWEWIVTPNQYPATKS